jgi:hypothetical protein
MKKEIIGDKMTIDFDDYSIEMYKNIDNSYGNNILYKDKAKNLFYPTPYCFVIEWDKDEDGGRIKLHQRDRWGSEMIFIHYAPTDIKGMFDFIGKGFNILPFKKTSALPVN